MTCAGTEYRKNSLHMRVDQYSLCAIWYCKLSPRNLQRTFRGYMFIKSELTLQVGVHACSDLYVQAPTILWGTFFPS